MKRFLRGIFTAALAIFAVLFAEPYIYEYLYNKNNPPEDNPVSVNNDGEAFNYPEFVWIEPDIPWKHIIKDFPHIYQNEDYPTGCESVSTVMVLNYLGYEITVNQFIDDYLPKMDIYAEGEGEDKVLYAPDPNEHFVGDPYDEHSLGCYAPVIEKSADAYLGDKWTVKNKTGTPLSKLIRAYTLNDIPVIFWATMDMKPSKEGNTWRIIDDEETEFTWISGEHCLVLIGYDGTDYYFSDPSKKDEITSFPRKIVEQRYLELGMQCVVIEP